MNNVRLGFETVLVTAHALGRILVLPPRDQRIDHFEGELGVEDIYNLAALNQQRGLRIINMDEFDKNYHKSIGQKAGGLRGEKLWKYIDRAADFQPAWWNKVFALPPNSADLKNDGGASMFNRNPALVERLNGFAMGRSVEYYGAKMQRSKVR